MFFKPPVYAVTIRDGNTVVNFRWGRVAFDLIKYASNSIFIQYGAKPIKYICIASKKTDSRKEFFFLSHRTNRNWVIKRKFKLFTFRIEKGITSKPLKIAEPLKKQMERNNYTQIGSHSCQSSTKRSASSRARLTT